MVATEFTAQAGQMGGHRELVTGADSGVLRKLGWMKCCFCQACCATFLLQITVVPDKRSWYHAIRLFCSGGIFGSRGHVGAVIH